MRRSRPNKASLKKEDDIKIGNMIQAEQVRLVGITEQPEILTLKEALSKAEELELDLVQISPDQEIPVVKIVDFGKYRFELLKKKKEAKKKQKVVIVKEIKMRPKIGKNDYDTKVRQTMIFLEKGDKVKITMMFKGRENAHKELGMEVIENFKEELKNVAMMEKEPSLEGPNIIMVVSPKK
jgi:translation initiation factor IF-3